MASTSAITAPTYAGYETPPGLQVSPYGAVIRDLKIYSFGLTSTGVISATSTGINYTISGLTTNDIPFALVPSTGVLPAGVAIGSLHIGAANTLTVSFNQSGTSTSGIPGVAAPGVGMTLFTMSYERQSSSTTT